MGTASTPMDSVPPRGMASRALTERFITTCSIMPVSPWTPGVPRAAEIRARWFRRAGVQHLGHVADDSRADRAAGLHDILAAEHEQLPREAGGAFGGEKNGLHGVEHSDGSDGLASSALEWPWMIVSMLLKSCATPAASWPTDSIFCDWRNWPPDSDGRRPCRCTRPRRSKTGSRPR